MPPDQRRRQTNALLAAQFDRQTPQDTTVAAGGYLGSAAVGAGVMGALGAGVGGAVGSGGDILRNQAADAEMLIRMSPQMNGPINWPPPEPPYVSPVNNLLR